MRAIEVLHCLVWPKHGSDPLPTLVHHQHPKLQIGRFRVGGQLERSPVEAASDVARPPDSWDGPAAAMRHQASLWKPTGTQGQQAASVGSQGTRKDLKMGRRDEEEEEEGEAAPKQSSVIGNYPSSLLQCQVMPWERAFLPAK